MPAPRPDARSTERPELQTARKSWGHHHPSASVMMTLFPAIRQRTLWIFAAVEASERAQEMRLLFGAFTIQIAFLQVLEQHLAGCHRPSITFAHEGPKCSACVDTHDRGFEVGAQRPSLGLDLLHFSG